MQKPTISRLRDDIDRGLTGDKVSAPDPATSPLGTDEEAAGTPVPPEALAQAHAYETTGPTSSGQGRPDLRRDTARTIAIAAAMVVAFLLAAAATLALIRP